MSETTETTALRTAVQVDGEPASYLTAGRQDAPPGLMLHGTYWSRVWLPVLDHLADAGLRPIAVDLPGLGRSGGRLTPETATVPALAARRVNNALTCPYHNGGTEGVNTKTKRLMRQMHGRAGFTLLRHRILLG